VLGKDLVKAAPLLLQPEQQLYTAVTLLIESGLDCAPVLEDGRLVGIFCLSLQVWAALQDGKTKEYDENSSEVTVVSSFMLLPPDCPGKIVFEEDLESLLNGLDLYLDTPIWVLGTDGLFAGMIMDKEIAAYFRAKIQTTQKQYEDILQNAYSCIVSIEKTGKITFINQALQRIFGMDYGELIGKQVEQVFPGTGLLKVLQSGRGQIGAKYELNGVKVVVNRTPIIEDGRVVGAVAIFQDMTELEEILKELKNVKELNKELNAVIDCSYDGIYVCDAAGRTIRVNKAIERLTGYKPEFYLGKNMRDLEKQGVLNESVTLKILKTHEPFTMVQRINTGKQTIITGTPVFGEDGKVFRVVTNVRDITELNFLREELARTQERYNNELQELRIQQMKVEDVVAKSREMCTILENAFRIAQVDTTVLILGESGVGKEVIAKMIHYSGPRSQQGSFIKINCGAIPRDLLESELFGYEPGSFTGSGTKTKLGLFELADKGTLFLDEIGDLPTDLQVKILRVLQENEFRRIGGNAIIQVNVRIITATNRDLESMVAQGKFREDLYYRLNVIPICIPPLRERLEDIPSFLHFFKEKFNLKYNTKKSFSPRAFDELVNYSWPGNVRQLANLVERLVVTCVEDIIDIHQLPEQVHSKEKGAVLLKLKEIVPLKEAVEEIEKQLINLALKKYENTYEAAKALGISQPTMSRKANKYSN